MEPHQPTHTLPRLYSHKKLTHTHHNKTNHQQAGPPSSKQRSVSSASVANQKSHHSANTSKAIKLEVTTAALHNKVEHLQTQEAILTQQIQTVKTDIAKLRLRNKGAEDSFSVASSRTSSFLPQDSKQKIDTLRRKLDKEKQRAKKTIDQVDKVRKDIQTTKKLNLTIYEQLITLEQQLNSETVLARQLEEAFALKTAEAQRKKIERVHQKANIIKEYDAIRHKLDNQLNSQGTAKANNFYLTDLISTQHPHKNHAQILPENSPKGHRTGNKAEYFRQKMEEWQGQTEAIKEKVKAQTLEEAEQKLVEIHQQNYHYYQFINQRNSALQELRLRNNQLKNQKLALLQQFNSKESSHTTLIISTTKAKIAKVEKTQKQLKAKIAGSQQVYQKTKAFVCQLIRQSGLLLPIQQGGTAIEQQVTQTSLSAFLENLLQLKQQAVVLAKQTTYNSPEQMH